AAVSFGRFRSRDCEAEKPARVRLGGQWPGVRAIQMPASAATETRTRTPFIAINSSGGIRRTSGLGGAPGNSFRQTVAQKQNARNTTSARGAGAAERVVSVTLGCKFHP